MGSPLTDIRSATARSTGANARFRALHGVTVLDLTQFAAGPYASMLLGDAGARVIKIEPPVRGEVYRTEGPKLPASNGTVGSYLLRFSRNKESVTLDLKSSRGRELFLALISRADVLIENFRPDTMIRLGLGYESLRSINPRLIYASITGFGQRDLLPSPYSDWAALAIVAEAMGGMMDRIGDESCGPHWSGLSAGDLLAGVFAAAGILMALQQRHLTAEGQHVDISMTDAITSLNERAVMSYGVTGVAPARGEESQLAPFGPFAARDGHVVIGVIGEGLWKRFCGAIGRTDLETDPRLRTGELRAAHLDAVLRPAIDEWLTGRSKTDAAVLLAAAGVPAAPVYDAREVAESDHTKAREMLVDVELPGYGTYRVVNSPIKLSADPLPRRATIPLLGEHTRSVLKEFVGLADAELDDLACAHVI